MKNTLLMSAAIVMMAGTVLTSCQSSAKKVENAQENVQDAKDNVDVANQELNQVLIDSIQQFKMESDEKINNNEKKIAEFKARIAQEKKENRANYEKKLAELEQKNSDMKMKLAGYNEKSQEKWTAFKIEFNHDMDELGQAFKDLTVKNTK